MPKCYFYPCFAEVCASLRVSDLLISDSGRWNRDTIQHLLPEYEAQILCRRPSLTGAPDKLIWLGTKSGEYTAKSGYYAAIDTLLLEDPSETSFNWKKNVWSLDVAPKVKTFSWKLLKQAIPVGTRLVERHIDVDPRCGQDESIIHLLFQCQFAQKVWLLAPFATEMDFSGIIDLLTDWPGLCELKCLPPAGITIGSLFPWILWTIWKARNRFIFEGYSDSPETTLSSAIKLAREWSMDSKPEITTNKRTPPPHPTAPADALIIRSDAAWRESDNTAGLGWCLPHRPLKTSRRDRNSFHQY